MIVVVCAKCEYSAFTLILVCFKSSSNFIFVESFHDKIKIGPEYICTCCDQLWYRSSVSLCSKSSYNNIVDCRHWGKQCRH